MTIEELKKKEKNEYMREYNKCNRKKINAQRKANRENLSDEEKEKRLALHRVADKKYSDKNRDIINAKTKKYKQDNKEKLKPKNRNYRLEAQKRGPDRIMIAAIKGRAKRKGLPFDLDKEWYNTEYKKGCAVTGLTLDPIGSKTAFVGHVDRTIPELGYVRSNCKVVCACYNLAKKDWSDADVMKMAKALVIRGADD